MSMQERFYARDYIDQILLEESISAKMFQLTLQECLPDFDHDLPYPSHATLDLLREETQSRFKNHINDALAPYFPNAIAKEIESYTELDFIIVTGYLARSHKTVIFAFPWQEAFSKQRLFVVKCPRDCSGYHSLEQVKNLLNQDSHKPKCGCTKQSEKEKEKYAFQRASSRTRRLFLKYHDQEMECFFRYSFLMTACHTFRDVQESLHSLS